jgi:protein-S-isoprenylcysteine O-methyltransferase Ste14
MNEMMVYWGLFIASAVISVGIFVLLFFISAPYGRHVREGWGPSISSKWGWIIMESPAIIIFFVLYALSDVKAELLPIIFLVIWMLHYVQRDLIFPFFLRTNKRMPLLIMTFGLLFQASNTYIQARWIFHFAYVADPNAYAVSWLYDPRFIIGVVLFLGGYIINRHADLVLRNLRKPGEKGYKIPFGGMYKFVSSPNYFGEILIWIGWGLAVWNWAGLLFAFWTIANLLPRARSHHNWYKETFSDYPEERKAIIPFLF